MRWTKLVPLLMSLAVALVAGCFNPSFENVRCENGEECPPGLVCDRADNTCKPSDQVTLGPLCGDETQDPDEVCDDGNTVSGDGCSADCLSDETCGNNIKDVGEVCDDGNTLSADGCSADCLSDETCGNDIKDVGEACDDGNTAPDDGCSPSCALESCGNSSLDDGEDCDEGGIDTQTCNANCTVAACNDRYVNAVAGEECDDGNGSDNDSCPSNCKNATCGDGLFSLSAARKSATTATTTTMTTVLLAASTRLAVMLCPQPRYGHRAMR